jgi:hypothetical protein
MDKEFAAVRRRLRELDDKIRTVEFAENTSMERSTGTVYLLQRYNEEYEEIDYLLRYWTRQNNGYHLGRWQWMAFSASVAVAAVLLVWYLIQVMR